jgi:protoheme IX farnesyltransferase
MKVVPTTAAVCTAEASPLALSARLADYVELTKPRISVLVLFTVAAGALLAGGGSVDPMLLLHTLAGTALVAAGASALNQWLERHGDALMKRTANRPLPAGRLQPMEAVVFGFGLGLAGLVYLAISLGRPWAALVAGFTFLSYVFVYTPLKRLTPLNTLIGAVPGALPPIIGWTAVRGSLDTAALVLFAVVFLWQVPHFLAIAWIYREEYGRAGLRMLTVDDRDGRQTARQMLIYCLTLTAVSLWPVVQGSAGLFYLVGALLLGLGFLASSLGFARAATRTSARRVLRASLIYLPALLTLLLLSAN